MRHDQSGGIIAVNNLRSWFERGDDVGGLLPVLQAYMGHSSPDDTAYYLQADRRVLPAHHRPGPTCLR